MPPAGTASAAPICPECGQDPRAGQPRAPFWARTTGLPLYLSLLVAAFCIVSAAATTSRFTQKYGVGVDRRMAGGLTVADVRAAAAGDTALAARLCDAALFAAGDSPWTRSWDHLEAASLSGSGRLDHSCEAGWPALWLTVYWSTLYSDLDTRGGPSAAPIGPLASRPYWSTVSGTLSWGWTAPSGIALMLRLDLPGLALALGLATAAVLAVRRAARRRPLRIRRAALLGGLAVALASICFVRTSASPVPGIPPPLTLSSPLLAEARRLARTPEGRIELARAAALQLRSATPGSHTALGWSPNGLIKAGGMSVGWPFHWFGTGEVSPDTPIRPTPDLNHSGLQWKRNGLVWSRTGDTGTTTSHSLSGAGLAGTLALVLLPALLLRTRWTLGRGRRLRRYRREGRCLTCGYEVGWLLAPAESATAPAGARAVQE